MGPFAGCRSTAGDGGEPFFRDFDVFTPASCGGSLAPGHFEEGGGIMIVRVPGKDLPGQGLYRLPVAGNNGGVYLLHYFFNFYHG